MVNTIYETIQSTVIENNRSDKYWKEPIIKIISAEDRNLALLREAVSAEHLMPHEILPNAQSIISFFIPFQDHVINSNIDGIMASEKWAMAYIRTNELIKTINDTVAAVMEQHGYTTGKIPATHNFDAEKLISNWSHRHIAYIAGMGTFGMHNMLITASGCCGRFGSIITDYEFKGQNEINKINEKCLHKINGSCGLCRKKCVASAYDNGIFDRQKCYQQCLKNAEYHKKSGYADVCGKCLVGLPCSLSDRMRH